MAGGNSLAESFPMAEESTVAVRLEVFVAQMRLANLKIENWLTFFALLRAKEKPDSGTTDRW